MHAIHIFTIIYLLMLFSSVCNHSADGNNTRHVRARKMTFSNKIFNISNENSPDIVRWHTLVLYSPNNIGIKQCEGQSHKEGHMRIAAGAFGGKIVP